MVIRVVEDLIEEEAPLEDLEILVDTEKGKLWTIIYVYRQMP